MHNRKYNLSGPIRNCLFVCQNCLIFAISYGFNEYLICEMQQRYIFLKKIDHLKLLKHFKQDSLKVSMF